MTEASRRTPTIEDVATGIERLMQLDSPHAPDWVGSNLTFGQLRLLFLLRHLGPLSIGALAERLGVTLASASETVERIERHAFVVRRHREDDRRVVECHLSEAGDRLVDEIAGLRLDGMRRVLGVLTPAELADFDRLIRVIGDRLEAAHRVDGRTPAGSVAHG